MKYEKTQKGNPHQLTVNQHCFPARSIERFVRNDGRVDVRRIKDSKNFRVKPNHSIFCARRAWDQRAESFMKEIEDVYQELADKIVSGEVLQLSNADQEKITDMYALWNIRWYWKQQPVQDQRIEGAIRPECEFSQDDQESLEKNRITAIGPNLTIKGPHLTGIKIQQNLQSTRQKIKDL